MIENKEMGVKIAESTDEEFWLNRKEEIENANKIEARNAKIRAKMLELAKEELK